MTYSGTITHRSSDEDDIKFKEHLSSVCLTSVKINRLVAAPSLCQFYTFISSLLNRLIMISKYGSRQVVSNENLKPTPEMPHPSNFSNALPTTIFMGLHDSGGKYVLTDWQSRYRCLVRV